ncbi:hypothetical protein [Marinobacterium aestuariivivens]|uniref:Potassium transporter TrkH n=1 Tax=Marinobacterium aestuariivivens TaxID=1698799 RepID=A0ABW2A6J5_9GAMM
MFRLFKPVLYVCGLLALLMTGLMLLPALIGWWRGDTETLAFLESALVTGLTGVLLVVGCRSRDFSLAPRQLYLLTSFSWVLLSVAGALPWYSAMPISALPMPSSRPCRVSLPPARRSSAGSRDCRTACCCGAPCCSGSAASA